MDYSSKAKTSNVHYFELPILVGTVLNLQLYYIHSKQRSIKTRIFGRSELFDPKMTRHFLKYARQRARELWQAWRIEFSYRNIREYKAPSKGRAPGADPRTRPFDRALLVLNLVYSRISLDENSILHACHMCTFGSDWSNMFVLICERINKSNNTKFHTKFSPKFSNRVYCPNL